MANFNSVGTVLNGQLNSDNFETITGVLTWSIASAGVLCALMTTVATEGAVKIVQSGALAAGKAGLWVDSGAAQILGAALVYVNQTSPSSTTPALLIRNNAKDMLSVGPSGPRVLQETKANILALTRAAGAVSYATDEKAPYFDDGIQLVPFMPTGAVLPFAGTSAPAGYLPCDGAAVSRTTYARLFTVINETHGQGDNSTTFNVPDYRGRFLRGTDTFGAGAASRDVDKAGRAAMATGGNTGDAVGSVQIQATKLPTAAFTTNDPGTHTHPPLSGSNFQINNGGEHTVGGTGLFGTDNLNATTGAGGAHSHSVNGGGDNETRPINAYVNFIIKT
jgi:microcystin-dependent protein